MDQAYVSTLAALAGTVIGGVTSFATAWLTQTAQARAARLAAERGKPEELYGRFIDSLALQYSHALSNASVDYDKLVDLFALKGRIMLLATPAVVGSAERSLKFLVDLSIAPPRGPAEMRAMMEDRGVDVIADFAGLCRRELQDLRLP